MTKVLLLSYLSFTTQLKKYCEENGLKMFAYIEVLIKRNCILNKNEKDLYGEN